MLVEGVWTHNGGQRGDGDVCTCASASGDDGHCALGSLGEHTDGYSQACGPGWVLMHVSLSEDHIHVRVCSGP